MLSWIARLLGNARRTTPPADTEAPKNAHAIAKPHPVAATPEADPAAAEGALLQQVLLDRQRRSTGYLFSLQEGHGAQIAAQSTRVRALLDDILIARLLALAEHWPGQRRAWLAIDEGALLHGSLPRLASLHAVLRLHACDAEQAAAPDTISRLRALQRAGLQIALDASPGSPWFESLAWLADRFVLDFANPPETLQRWHAQLSSQYPLVPRTAIAVDTLDALDAAWKLGCSEASGAFSQLRGDWQGNRLAPGLLHAAALLARVGADTENSEIAAALKQDMALSYRLLRYVNTASGGLQHSIGSIEQALLLLGREQLYRWLALLVCASAKRPDGDAMMETALVRARMLEQLGDKIAPAARDDLFVTGLFSQLDMLLQVPMRTALEPLALTPAVREALLERSGPCADWLAVAEAGEAGDPVALLVACRKLGIPAMRAAGARLAALAWVHALSAEPAVAET
ncbi:HDOD domain-containing protein [Niveibacterium sp. 24ML]|uniref:EAL and HDOD domain-containing protein n=1 Tax=Niveibacterium sp. 24ML TaxID=2985512 RepID=UPI00226FC615|nr:HDOD domain-containing protein [Niveibacterium sp. 24ML]MCX9157466.1 HDOD domain-containing protein [Niveibacterium sp. 24ML]